MNGVTGGSVPAAIWRAFVTQAAAQKALPATSYPPAILGVDAPAGAGDPLPAWEQPSSAGTIRGRAFVLDTGTLEVQGHIVRLLGIEGLNGRLARRLRRFLHRREVFCEPASAHNHRCTADGQDLSELILLNGAAERRRTRPPIYRPPRARESG